MIHYHTDSCYQNFSVVDWIGWNDWNDVILKATKMSSVG